MDEPRHVPLHLASDRELVATALDGDRIAFGLLYLRHHGAAWRLASVTSGFSDDAELAVMIGFTEVFSILPAGADHFRPALLGCVRLAALERSRGRPSRPSWPGPSEVRAALVALHEPRRAVLWLTDVEALTPSEVAAVMRLPAAAIPEMAADARRWVKAVTHQPLASATPPPPLLGGECQRHWLTSWKAPRPAAQRRRARRQALPTLAVASAN